MAKERVQVQGLGGAVPGISPTIQRGGQYSVQVQQAGRNKLMDLADALGQVNPLLQQYGKLQKVQEQIGVEEAELIERDQLLKEAKRSGSKGGGGFSPFANANREIGRRDALLKRHINEVALPNLSLKAKDLINPEAYESTEDFNQAVQAVIAQEQESLTAAVGSNMGNSAAAKALWNAVVPKYTNELALKYEQEKEKFVINQTLNEGHLQLEALGSDATFNDIESVVTGYDKVLDEKSPHLTKQERTAHLTDMMKIRLESLLARRRFQDASKLRGYMEGVKVNGNSIFQSKASDKVLNSITKEINNKIASLKTENKTVADKEWSGLWGGALKRLPASMTYERFQNNPLSVQTVKDALLFMNPTLVDGEEEGQLDYIIKNEIFNTEVAPSLALNDALLRQAYSDPDRALPLYRRTQKSVGTFIAETAGALEREVNLYSPSVRAELEQEFLTAHEIASAGGKEYDFDEFLGEKGIDASPWTSARATSKEANAGLFATQLDEFKKIEATIKTDITGIAQDLAGDKKIDDALPPKFDETHAMTSAPVIKQKVLEYAKAVELDESIPAVKKQGMVVKEIRRLQDEDKAIFKQLAEIAKQRVKEFAPPEEVELEQARAAVQKEKEKYRPGEGLLKQFFKEEPSEYKSFVEGRPTFNTINKDRQSLMASIKNKNTSFSEQTRLTSLLKASVYDHGFSGYSPESAEVLKQTGFDFGDVVLFGSKDELDEVTLDRWLTVIDKLEGEQRQELTKEDKALLKEFGEFKVYDDESFMQFRKAQITLMRDRDSR
jgi:hypothetical protein